MPKKNNKRRDEEGDGDKAASSPVASKKVKSKKRDKREDESYSAPGKNNHSKKTQKEFGHSKVQKDAIGQDFDSSINLENPEAGDGENFEKGSSINAENTSTGTQIEEGCNQMKDQDEDAIDRLEHSEVQKDAIGQDFDSSINLENPEAGGGENFEKGSLINAENTSTGTQIEEGYNQMEDQGEDAGKKNKVEEEDKIPTGSLDHAQDDACCILKEVEDVINEETPNDLPEFEDMKKNFGHPGEENHSEKTQKVLEHSEFQKYAISQDFEKDSSINLEKPETIIDQNFEKGSSINLEKNSTSSQIELACHKIEDQDEDDDKISCTTRTCGEEDEGEDEDKISSGTRILCAQDDVGFILEEGEDVIQNEAPNDFSQFGDMKKDFGPSGENNCSKKTQTEFDHSKVQKDDIGDDFEKDSLINLENPDADNAENFEKGPSVDVENASTGTQIEEGYNQMEDQGKDAVKISCATRTFSKEDKVEKEDKIPTGSRVLYTQNDACCILKEVEDVINEETPNDLPEFEDMKKDLEASDLMHDNFKSCEAVRSFSVNYTSPNKNSVDHYISSKEDISVKSPAARVKRDWHEESLSKLTCVRSALRQRGNIKSLVSKFESLAENPDESSITANATNVSSRNIPSYAKIYQKNFTPQKKSIVEQEKEHSPAGRSTMRSSSSKAIDQMFDFVQKADMLTPKSTMAFRSCHSTPRRPVALSTSFTASQSDNRSYRDVSEKDELIFREKSKTLLMGIESLKNQIGQAVEAIALCQKKHEFNGTLQELSAQRILLVANERRLLLIQEMNKLKEIHSLRHTSAGKGWVKMPDVESHGTCIMDITSISFRLERTFYIKTADEDSSFVFVLIVKSGGQIYATQLLDVMDMGTLRSSTVQVRESIRFEQLPTNFVTSIEIFAIKTVHRQISYSSAASKIASRAKAFLVGKPKSSDSEQETYASSMSDFFRCGVLHLNRESVGKHHFTLSDSQYPLDGSIELRAAYVFGRKNSFGSIEHL